MLSILRSLSIIQREFLYLSDTVVHSPLILDISSGSKRML